MKKIIFIALFLIMNSVYSDNKSLDEKRMEWIKAQLEKTVSMDDQKQAIEVVMSPVKSDYFDNQTLMDKMVFIDSRCAKLLTSNACWKFTTSYDLIAY